ILPSDRTKVSAIAEYMRNNPSLRIGIDGSVDPRGDDSRDLDLRNRRINAVGQALRQAGVPAQKLGTGMIGDPQLRREGRVAVLIATDRR
ncbi:MAG: OmpA family protein, partial [Candidatus Sumerlaeota bacterium]|nr:OmpA family protein [Candidatus Sumerlaeota bacterium]